MNLLLNHTCAVLANLILLGGHQGTMGIALLMLSNGPRRVHHATDLPIFGRPSHQLHPTDQQLCLGPTDYLAKGTFDSGSVACVAFSALWRKYPGTSACVRGTFPLTTYSMAAKERFEVKIFFYSFFAASMRQPNHSRHNGAKSLESRGEFDWRKTLLPALSKGRAQDPRRVSALQSNLAIQHTPFPAAAGRESHVCHL